MGNQNGEEAEGQKEYKTGAEDHVRSTGLCFEKSRAVHLYDMWDILINLFMCFLESMMSPQKSDLGMSHREGGENDLLLHDPTW